MGCSSQNGCLGPKPRQRQVYLDLIQTIHHEATTMVVDQNEDLYTSMKDQLAKKNLLRKLIDNLVSHKANLQECLNQNYQKAVQSSNIRGRMASLIIVDKIVDECLRDKSSDERNSLEKDNILLTNSNQNVIENNLQLPLYNQITSDIYYHTSTIFLKLISYLFSKERQLQKQNLSSLNHFLGLKTDKLRCRNQVNRIFQYLIQNIKQNKLIYESADALALILSRSKQNMTTQIKKEHIVYFLKLWISGKQDYGEGKTKGIFNVLQQYFNRNYGSYQLLNLSIINVLDEILFDIKVTNKIQQLIFNLSTEVDIIKQFMKSLFVFLLNYLQIGNQLQKNFQYSFKNIQNQICKLNGFRVLTKWILDKNVNADSIIEYNPSVMIGSYVYNIQKKASPSFQTDLTAQFFKVVQSLNQDSMLTITNILASEMREKNISNKKRKVLFKLFSQIYKSKISLITNEKYIDKIKFAINIQRFYSKELKLQLLSFASFGIKNINILMIKSSTESYDTLCLKMVQFMFSIYQEIVSSFIENDTDNSGSSNSLINKSDLNKIQFINKFVCQFVKLFKILNDCKLQSILLSFFNNINAYLIDFDPDQNEQNAIVFFFLVFILQKGMFIMNSKETMSQEISKLSIKLQLNQTKLENRSQIISTAKNMLKSPYSVMLLQQCDAMGSSKEENSKIRALINKNSTKIEDIVKLYMIQEDQLKQIQQMFKQQFRSLQSDNKNHPSFLNNSARLFNRMPSINIAQDQMYNQKSSQKYEGEESFRQIIQKMRQE